MRLRRRSLSGKSIYEVYIYHLTYMHVCLANSGISDACIYTVWWTLCMIDVWSSAGVRLPRSLIPQDSVPLAMEETLFLSLTTSSDAAAILFSDSSRSLLGQMIKLNVILADINLFNELTASNPDGAYDIRSYGLFETMSRKLEGWQQNLPAELQDTEENFARFASQGLGDMFVAVYLGYYNYGQMLYYHFLHPASLNNASPQIQTYALKCKAHATGLCQIIYRANATPHTSVLYAMVGHIIVIASTIHLHILLFSPSDAEIRGARHRLEENFKILTRLQRYWPSLDLSFARLKEFHGACLRSKEGEGGEKWRMDRWMVRFLVEYAKPVGEREREEMQGDDVSWTMGNLGFSPVGSEESPLE